MLWTDVLLQRCKKVGKAQHTQNVSRSRRHASQECSAQTRVILSSNRQGGGGEQNKSTAVFANKGRSGMLCFCAPLPPLLTTAPYARYFHKEKPVPVSLSQSLSWLNYKRLLFFGRGSGIKESMINPSQTNVTITPHHCSTFFDCHIIIICKFISIWTTSVLLLK